LVYKRFVRTSETQDKTQPALFDEIVTAKFQDHLPYARQEKQFERIGVCVSRQDMANRQEKVGIMLRSLYVVLKAGKVLRMDETTVPVMGEEGRKDPQKSYLWLARGRGKGVVIFKESSSRRAENIDECIQGFHGYLQTDGYAGYASAVKGRGGIIPVGCFTHAQRKFFEAQKTGVKAKPAASCLSAIKGLYEIDHESREGLKRKELDEATSVSERKEGSLVV
jgi:transposase